MQERILHIKNMVCHRCILAVADILRQEGLEAQHIELGTATLPALPTAEQRERLRKRLKEKISFSECCTSAAKKSRSRLWSHNCSIQRHSTNNNRGYYIVTLCK